MEVLPITKNHKHYSCECCSKDFGSKKSNYLKHLGSVKHLKLVNSNNSILEEPKNNNINFEIEEKQEETVEEVNEEEEPVEENNDGIERNDFLNELNFTNFQKEKDEKLKEQELVKMEKELQKEMKKQPKPKEQKIPNDDPLYSDNPTEILGADRLVLIHKIKQYKLLFKDELKSFKIKKNPSISELKLYIDEMDTIVNTTNCDNFITDSILQSIRIIEGVSSNTKNYNITGLSEILKTNPQFNTLVKQLYLKYGVFSKMPPESQLVFIVITSAYVCRNVNMKRGELNSFLDEKIII